MYIDMFIVPACTQEIVPIASNELGDVTTQTYKFVGRVIVWLTLSHELMKYYDTGSLLMEVG